MIARIDGGGLSPILIASRFAEVSFGEPRAVDVPTFRGEYTWCGYKGSFRLEKGSLEYGMRWFKRRGRMFAFYRVDDASYKCGSLDALAGDPVSIQGESQWQWVSYLDGYLDGLPRKLKAERRREVETDVYTQIDSLLYGLQENT